MPKGFKPFPALRKFGNQVGAMKGVAPNGVDFWWDEGGIGSVTRNCWYNNIGPTARPPRYRPGCGRRQRHATVQLRHEHHNGDQVKVNYLLSCFLAREGDPPPEQLRLVHVAAQARVAAAARKQRAFAAGAREFQQDGAREASRTRSAAHRHPDSQPSR